MKKGIDFVGTGVCYFCHDGKGNIIFGKRGDQSRDEKGVWDIGGGSIEFGDSVEKTLNKEIKEEYGTEIISYEFLGYRDVFRENTHWIVLDFKVLVDPAQVKNSEPHKFDSVEWFTLSNIPSPVHSQLPIFLAKYKDKLK
jgi:8-oxo-dGTP diphosphatase